MHPFGVVPDEPVNEFAVEDIRFEKWPDVVVDKLVLNSAVETLQMGIHFRGLRIGVIMGQMQSLQFFREVFGKFRTVIGQNI